MTIRAVMKTPGKPFASFIEILESRIAPAALTFLDVDGDIVQIFSSKGTDAQLGAAAQFLAGSSGQQLQVLNLASNSVFAGANISIDVVGGTGDGLVDVGFIRAPGLDLGRVHVDGDLCRIVAGDANTANGSVRALVVQTMGQADSPLVDSSRSFLTGKLNVFRARGDVSDVTITVSGGLFDLDGQIGMVDIRGDLLGGDSTRSGAIVAKGAIGTVRIGGSIVGGNGAESGSVITERTLGTLTINEQLRGGDGVRSGRVFAADQFSNATISGNILGGGGEESGTISSFTGLGNILVEGRIIGGLGRLSGVIGSGGDVASVQIGNSIVGGDGALSGAILAKGSIANARATFLVGGSGEQSGAIGAEGFVGKVNLLGIQGGEGRESGAVGSKTGLGKVVVRGDVGGGSGDSSGAILSAGFIDRVIIRSSDPAIGLIGGTGRDSGVVGAVGPIGSVLLQGSLIGGVGLRSGAIGSEQFLGSIHITGSIRGGGDFGKGGPVFGAGIAEGGLPLGGDFSGRVVSGGAIGEVLVDGSVVGGAGLESGAIGSFGGIGKIAIRGDLVGGNIQERAGSILSGGDLGRVEIGVRDAESGGSIIGGNAPDTGAIVCLGDLGVVIVERNMVGSFGANSGSISGENSVSGDPGGTIRRVVVRGIVQGGFGQNSGTIQSTSDITTIAIGRDDGEGGDVLLGGDGNFSGSVISGSKIGKITINGGVVGGAGRLSGVIETDGDGTDGDMNTVIINGTLRGGEGQNSGLVFSSGAINSISVGALQGGPGKLSGSISSELGIESVVINGNVDGGAGDFSGQIVGGNIKSVSIAGSIRGGDGLESGAVIATVRDLATVNIGGSLISGLGVRSGLIAAQRNLISLTLDSTQVRWKIARPSARAAACKGPRFPRSG